MTEEYDQLIEVQIQAILKIYLSYVKSVGKGDSLIKPNPGYDSSEELEELYQKLAVIYHKRVPDEELKESIVGDIKQYQKNLLKQGTSDIEKRTKYLNHIPKCLHLTIEKFKKEQKFWLYKPILDVISAASDDVDDDVDDDDDNNRSYVEVKWGTTVGIVIDNWITKLYRNKGKNETRINSEIINKDHIKLFTHWINKKDQSAYNSFNNKYEFKLIYSSNKDGSVPMDFHAKCDYIRETITVVKVNTGQIIGGYNPVSWNIVNSKYYHSNDCFIFNISSHTTAKIGRAGINTNSIFCNSGYMPTFGGGADLRIYSDKSGYCIPSTYPDIGLPTNFNFSVFEVFQVISKT
ncbi:hypothetical protein RhiirA1_469922 [Rhizophagus irregularis]|nr:hypothetical protein RhiirA1_469922 [Rhizophagus irregularis]PKY28498.1 hypothetical protein RhiirB3_444689 [Rhizophagus irregularis]GBC37429.1 BTB/POZ domain-containing protein [Rhizophagus irregularis DAOM 181602=DAOM 197198]